MTNRKKAGSLDPELDKALKRVEQDLNVLAAKYDVLERIEIRSERDPPMLKLTGSVEDLDKMHNLLESSIETLSEQEKTKQVVAGALAKGPIVFHRISDRVIILTGEQQKISDIRRQIADWRKKLDITDDWLQNATAFLANRDPKPQKRQNEEIRKLNYQITKHTKDMNRLRPIQHVTVEVQAEPKLITISGEPSNVAAVKALITQWLNDQQSEDAKQDAKQDQAQGKDQAANQPKPASQTGWIARGTITDADGKPLKGVRVWANTGVGSLRRTGEAITDENGEYELAFGPSMRRFGGDDSVGVQAATIFASKPGFAEKDLCSAGNRLMAAKMPTTATAWGTVDQVKDRIIIEDQPVTIDFVMHPAATIEGYLVDSDGNLLQKRSVSVTGPQLPPSSNVLDQVYADLSGKFTIPNVPLNKTWKYAFRIPNSFQQLHSDEFQFDSAGVYRVVLEVDFKSDPPTISRRELTPGEESRLSGRALEMREQPTVRGKVPPRNDDRKLVWGKERNGLRAAVAIGTGEAVACGDQLDVEFLVRNVSGRTISFESSSWRQEDNLRVREVGGRPQDVAKSWYSGLAIIKTYQLRPGEEVAIESAKISVLDPADKTSRGAHPTAYHVHLKPGKYSASFRIRLPDVRQFPAKPGDAWRGSLYTGEVEFEVAANN